MSDTPRTDAAVIDLHTAVMAVTNPDGSRAMVTRYVDANFARRLERDRALLRGALKAVATVKDSEFGRVAAQHTPVELLDAVIEEAQAALAQTEDKT